MKVEFTATVEDAVAFHVRSARRSGELRRNRARSSIRFLSLLLLMLLVSWHESGKPGLAKYVFSHLSWIVILLVSLGLFPWLFPWLMSKRHGDEIKRIYSDEAMQSLFGYSAVTITPEVIHNDSHYSKVSIRWKAVREIVESDEFVDIYLTGMSAITIPRSAFQSGEEFQAFVELARKYHAAAIGQSAAGA